MPQQIRELYEALELIADERNRWSKALAAIRRESQVPVKREVQKKTG